MKLIKPVLRIAYVALALVYFAACSNSSGSSATTPETFGNIQIVFTANVTDTTGSGAPLKNVLLNVSNVLVNTTEGASTSATNWRTIPGPTQAPAGSPPGAFQMDLNAVAGLPVIYNTTEILTGNYQTLQIQLDPSPGAIVPLCAGGPEGCILYPLQLTATQPITIPVTALLQTNKPVTLVINLNLDITGAPAATGGAYTATLTANVANNADFVATVTSVIKGNPSSTIGAVQTLTAFVAGTDTFVTSVPIGPANTFTLTLPATEAGALYDLVVSGNDATYEALRLPPLQPKATPSANLTVTSGETVGAMAGRVVDTCTGAGIEGATVELLVAPANQDTITLETCNSLETIAECIVAISTTTDITGQYPIINAGGNPTGSFAEIPSLPLAQPTATPGPYLIDVSATGYTTLLAYGTSNGSVTDQAGICVVNNGPKGLCNFPLQSNLVGGNVVLTSAPAAGQNVSVTVFAETTGTTNLVAMSQPISFTSSTPLSQAFTMHVPVNSTLDFFAQATDTFQGAADPYPGHTVDIKSAVPTGPLTSPCTTVNPIGGGGDPNYSTFTLDCAGHGSVSGSLAGGNNLTSVVLSKTGLSPAPAPTSGQVQLFTGNALGTTSDSYAICAPADSYTATRFQVSPVLNVTPVATPTPVAENSTAVALPTPAPTSSGCPTTCLNTDGSCPGNCMNVPNTNL